MTNLKKFAIGVASAALVAGMGVAPAVAADATRVVLPGGQSFNRVAGDTRVDTAFEIAKQAKADGVATTKIYIVNSKSNVDAATSGMLTDGVVLLAPADEAGQLKLGLRIKNELQPTSGAKLVAIGGTSVVPDSVMSNIKSTSGLSIGTRLGGATRYDTNLAIAKSAFATPGTVTNKYIVSGTSIVDAITSGAIKNGPVLMVPTTGDVPAATVNYYKSLNHAAAMIIGGEGAVPAAQVAKLEGSQTTTNPWSYTTTNADLKKAVQKAAALYLGQKAWQEGAADEEHYFGLAKTGLADATNPEPGSVTDDAIKSGVTESAKAFIGWKASYDKLETAVGVIDTHVATLEAALMNDLNGLKNTAPDASTSYTAAADAYKALYGHELKAPTVANGAVTDWGSFEHDALGRLNGKLVKEATDFVATDAASTDKVGSASINGVPADYTYAGLAGLSYTTLPTDITPKAADKFDWAALKVAADTKLAEQQKLTVEAKKALDEAVAAYKAGPTWKVTQQGEAGIPRLAGKDRYETAALLSYYLTEGANLGGYAAQISTTLHRAYVASGDDAHLVDSVVGGQLTQGPLLLVPTKSDTLGEFTSAELKRLAGKSKNDATWKTMVLGGKNAVADASFNAAVNAFKDGLK